MAVVLLVDHHLLLPLVPTVATTRLLVLRYYWNETTTSSNNSGSNIQQFCSVQRITMKKEEVRENDGEDVSSNGNDIVETTGETDSLARERCRIAAAASGGGGGGQRCVHEAITDTEDARAEDDEANAYQPSSNLSAGAVSQSEEHCQDWLDDLDRKNQKAIQEHNEKVRGQTMAQLSPAPSTSSSNVPSKNDSRTMRSSPEATNNLVDQPLPLPQPQQNAANVSIPGAYAVVQPSYYGEHARAITIARDEAAASAASRNSQNYHAEDDYESNDNENHGHDEGETLVTAELVSDPVHAVPVIVPSESSRNNDMDQYCRSSDLERAAATARGGGGGGGGSDFESSQNLAQEPSSPKEKVHFFNQGTIAIGIMVAILVAAAIAIAVPVSLMQDNSTTTADNSSSNNNNNTLRPSFPYECFHETHPLNLAIADNPDQKVFVICPDTFVHVGELDASDQGTRFVNGEPPLVITRGNLEIRCGPDGSINNNCTLSSGLLHVMTQEELGANGWGLVSKLNTDNLTLRGLTFTGEVGGNILWGGGSLILSNSGKNVQVVDCLWENITAPTGLVFLGRNMMQIIIGQKMPDQALDVTIVNSTFRNVVYDGPLMRVFNQTLSLQGCQFENTRLTPYLRPCSLVEADFCQGLVYCYDHSVCHLEDICVHDLEYYGKSAILSASRDTQWTLPGSSSVEGLEFRQASSGITESESCASGVGQFVDDSHTLISCIEEEDDRFWMAESNKTCI